MTARSDRSTPTWSRLRSLHISCIRSSMHAKKVQIPGAAHSESLVFDEILLDMGVDHAVAIANRVGGVRGLHADQSNSARLAVVPLANCIVVGEGAFATAHARNFPDALMETLSLISKSGQQYANNTQLNKTFTKAAEHPLHI